MGIAEMEIRSFAEMQQSVWDRIKTPIIAVYKDPDAIQRPKHLAKVCDGGDYTGIFMRMDNLEKLHEDIRIYAFWLNRVDPGTGDDPSLLCAYIYRGTEYGKSDSDNTGGNHG